MNSKMKLLLKTGLNGYAQLTVENESGHYPQTEHPKVYSLGMADFAQQFLGLQTMVSGILPPAVRWISGNGTAIIAERPPFEVSDLYTGEVMSLPWTVYALSVSPDFQQIHHFSAFARPSQIFDPHDVLYMIPFTEYAMHEEQVGATVPIFSGTQLTNLASEDIPIFSDMVDEHYHGDWRFVTMAEALLAMVAHFWQVFSRSVASRYGLHHTHPFVSVTPELFASIPHAWIESALSTDDARITEALRTWQATVGLHNVDAVNWREFTPTITVQHLMDALKSFAATSEPLSLEQRLLKCFTS